MMTSEERELLDEALNYAYHDRQCTYDSGKCFCGYEEFWKRADEFLREIDNDERIQTISTDPKETNRSAQTKATR